MNILFAILIILHSGFFIVTAFSGAILYRDPQTVRGDKVFGLAVYFCYIILSLMGGYLLSFMQFQRPAILFLFSQAIPAFGVFVLLLGYAVVGFVNLKRKVPFKYPLFAVGVSLGIPTSFLLAGFLVTLGVIS
jgi:hypothetical protein